MLKYERQAVWARDKYIYEEREIKRESEGRAEREREIEGD